MPPIAVGQVIDYLPWNGGLKVQFRNAQIFGGAQGVGSVTMRLRAAEELWFALMAVTVKG